MAVRPPPREMLRQFRPLYQAFISQAAYGWFLGGQPPIIISSWYRSPEVNRNTKGSHPRSLHMLGLALDLELPLSTLAQHAELVDGMERAELIAVDEVDHVHVQAFARSALDS